MFISAIMTVGLVNPTILSAQDFPTRPISMIVPFAPGASTDIVMRLVGQKLSESVRQPFIVDNRSGGGGTTGGVAVKNAAPDGYTLLFGNAGTHAINPSMMKDFPYDPVRDFQPITNLISFASVLVVPTDSRAKTLADLVAMAKSKPDGLTYASQGVGSAGHLIAEMFRAKIGAKMVHIPYKGGAPATLDTIAGRVDFLFASYLTAGAYIRDGKLRALGFTASRRSIALPDIPTMAEAGVPDVVLEYWFGVFAPARTPSPIVRKLNEEFRKAAHHPDVTKIITSQAADVVTSSPEEFSALVKADGIRLGKIMNDASGPSR
jgi:tripartite-type tricarboxylate transporter receptor subunit TctC